MSCFVITTTYDEKSVSQFFFALAHELAGRGHRVVVIVGEQRRDVEDRASNPILLTWPSFRPTKWRDALFLNRVISTYQPDCIVGNFAAVNLCLLIGWLRGIPQRIAWYHTMRQAIDTDNAVPGWWRGFTKWRKRLIYKLATKVIAISQAAAADVQQIHAVPPAKCAVLHTLLAAPPTQHIKRAAHKVVCVGRLHQSKGQATLLKAAPLIRAAVAEVEIEFVGAGPEKARFEALAHNLGVADCCQFSGALPPAQAIERLAGATVSVVTAQSEALSLVCVESLAVGTPVVASAVDGIKEVVRDGETGYLVPPEDAAAFAQKIVALLTDAVLWQQCSERATRHFAASFSRNGISRYADYFEKLVAETSASAVRQVSSTG